MAKNRRSSGRSVSVDMTGVETGVTVPEGDYTVEVAEITQETSDNSGKQYLAWKFKITEGANEGSSLFYNTSLQPQALFNLKNVLIALGVSVPNSTLKLNLDEMLELTCGATVEHETWEGKKKSRIVDFYPLDGSGSDGEDDDEEVNLAEMDLDELIAYAKKEEIDLSSLSKKDMKKVSKVKAAIEEALEDDDDDPNVDEMSLQEMLDYAKEKEINLGLSKKNIKKEAKVREALKEALKEDDV